jgi:hypothetical protein
VVDGHRWRDSAPLGAMEPSVAGWARGLVVRVLAWIVAFVAGGATFGGVVSDRTSPWWLLLGLVLGAIVIASVVATLEGLFGGRRGRSSRAVDVDR